MHCPIRLKYHRVLYITKFFPDWISADFLLTYTVYPRDGDTGRLDDPVYKIKKGRATHFSTLDLGTVSLFFKLH